MSDSSNQSKETSTQSPNPKKEEDVPLLFLGNLAPDVKVSDLKSFFGEVGDVRYVNIPTSKHTGESKGVGYIQYENIQQAQKAIQELDGKKFQGRHIRVQFARPFSETERKRAEKRHFQIPKSSKRGIDINSPPDYLRRSSGIARRDYDIPREYEDGGKPGISSQSLNLRKPSSPPLLHRREAYDDRDRDRYERERSRNYDRYRDYYDREPQIAYDPIDVDHERDRSLYRERFRDRERDLREKDLRDWDRIRSEREYESRREPAIIYDSIPRARDYDRDIDRTFRDRVYERPREYYDRDDYYIDRDRDHDRDRDYYHMIYSERPPIQYERDFEVQSYDAQHPQIQAVPPQLPPTSPQLSRDYARIRAAQPPLPSIPDYDTREIDEYYQRTQQTPQQASTPNRIAPPAPPPHYMEYDDQPAIPTDITYDGLVPPPLPAPPPLPPPQSLPGPQTLPSPQALQKMSQLGSMRLPPGFDIGQLGVRPTLGTMLPPPPPPQVQQQQPLPLPPRLAATHGLHSQYDTQIDPQNQ